MADNDRKSKLLDAEGYHYNFVRMVYINREKRKIFSLDGIEKNDIYWTSGRMLEESIPNEWQIYFHGEEPSEALRAEIISEIESA